MDQLLTPEARVRLGNINAVKPEKADALSLIIIQNARTGRIQGKVTESQLIDLMNQMSEIDSKDNKIEIKRQKFDDDDDLDIDNMGF